MHLYLDMSYYIKYVNNNVVIYLGEGKLLLGILWICIYYNTRALSKDFFVKNLNNFLWCMLPKGFMNFITYYFDII